MIQTAAFQPKKIEITSPYEEQAEQACEKADQKWVSEMKSFDASAKYVCIKPY